MNEPIFGTPEYMLRRNEDPETSHAAAEQVDTTKMEAIIFDCIKTFSQENGCTSFDIFQRSGTHPWSISPRIKGLERNGYIYYRGDTRKGGSNRQMRIMRVERRKKERVMIENQNEFSFLV